MKIRNIYRTTVLAFIAYTVCSCDSFLDTVPDQRTQVDSEQKVTELLVSAYPVTDPMMMYEHRTDNVMDNGVNYSSSSTILIENYFWQDITSTSQDSPEYLWNYCYRAIASANQAIEAMQELGMISSGAPQYGEALLCRAYAHFLLANTFCNPYSPTLASTDLGIPYVEEPEKTIGKQYSRGTLQEVYEKIERDIETGFPLIDDNLYSVPLYHFNQRAAAAFATRFFLFFGKYDKALKYANIAIDENPSASLRDLATYTTLTTLDEWRNRFISKDEPANLLLTALFSLWGRNYYSPRYGHSQGITSTLTYGSTGPWGRNLTHYDLIFGGSSYPVKFQPKYQEIFEITDETSQTGYPHVVQMAFTTDETLLCRAEIYTMLQQYDRAAQDLSYWYVKKGGSAATSAQIISYYANRKASEIAALSTNSLDPWLVLVKELNPVGFSVADDSQEMMLQAVLHARKIETLFSGLRWLDIRRFGIEVVHNVANGTPIVLPVNDRRRTIQIPESVVTAGLQANP